MASRPICVIAGDIHYNLTTMHVADEGVRLAINKANELNIPFVSNGDMLDQKAVMRAEYVNMIIETFKTAKLKPYVNVGNHSRINERAPEHALNFLRPYAHVIDVPAYIPELSSYVIPYDHNPSDLVAYLSKLPKNSRLIMHQGVGGALAGEYIIDKSAIPREALSDFRTILSHYHSRQDIVCGRPRKGTVGLASYIGNLYTLGFGEANDPEKGFQVLMDDGTLEFVPTNLRKHVIIDFHIDQIDWPARVPSFRPQDLVWVKLRGPKEHLSAYSKQAAAKTFQIEGDFRLDLIPTETETSAANFEKDLTHGEMLDAMIDSLTNTSNERKARLKELWRNNASN